MLPFEPLWLGKEFTVKYLFLFLHVQSLKTYQLYHGEWQQAEAKMRHAENQRMKMERQQSTGSGVTAAKSALSRRFRNVEKLSEKVCHFPPFHGYDMPTVGWVAQW